MDELAVSSVGLREVTERFRNYGQLTVRQRKRWVEILLSFEMKNQYEVYDENQQPVLRVQEVSTGIGAFLRRVFLGPMRPFQVHVADPMTDEVVLILRRPFRFIFHRLEVMSGSGEALGAIEKRWSWVRRLYVVEDASGHEIARLFGPVLKPWTFEIHTESGAVGAIRKKWSGLGKEMFTDADNFGVDLHGIADAALRALVFAATVLVDVVHFERAKR